MFIKRPYSIGFKVSNENQDPVAGAMVYINDKFEGVTNNVGYLKVSSSYVIRSELQIRVEKKSSKYYYAPHESRYTVSQNQQKKHHLKVTLYSVPKPQMLNQKEVLKIKKKSKHEKRKQFNLPAPKIPDIYYDQTFHPMLVDQIKQHEEEKLGPRKISFYIYSKSSRQPIEGATIERVSLNKSEILCKTNPRGRCTLYGKEHLRNILVLVSAPNHQSSLKTVSFHKVEKDHIYLSQGKEIIVRAYSKIMGNKIPASNVEISINSTKIGFTNKMGITVIPVNNKIGDFVTIKVENSKSDPPTMKFDSLISSRMTMELEYTARHVGIDLDDNIYQKSILISKNKNLLDLDKTLKKTISDFIKTRAFHQSDNFILKAHVLYHNPQESILGLFLHNHNDQIIAGIKVNLSFPMKDDEFKNTIENAIAKIYQNVTKDLVIASIENSFITVKTPQPHTYSVGDIFGVYGVKQHLNNQPTFQSERVATLVITNTSQLEIKGYLSSKLERSHIFTGSKVLLESSKEIPMKIRVLSKTYNLDGKPIPKTLIFADNTWIGSTNKEGMLKTKLQHDLEKVEAFKENFGLSKRSIINSSNVLFDLPQINTTLAIDSDPIGAIAYLDNQMIGITPFVVNLSSSEKKRNLIVTSPHLRQSIQKSISLNQERIDFTGKKSISFVSTPFLEAYRLSLKKKYTSALDKLTKISPTSKEYIPALYLKAVIKMHQSDPRNRIDIINLTKKVSDSINTSHNENPNLLLSYLYYGIALYQKTSEYSENTKEQLSNYKKITQALSSLEKNSNSLPKKSFSNSMPSLYYYLAKSFAQLAKISGSQETSDRADRYWSKFIQSSTITGSQKKDLATQQNQVNSTL